MTVTSTQSHHAEPADGGTPRERILDAAVQLLSEGGREAVTTRAVMTLAKVQAPTIFRQYGDLRALLVQAASVGFASYLTGKARQELSADPVEDLRAGWDAHVAFGLAEPVVYALLYGDPRQGQRPTAVQQARSMLRGTLQRVAEDGRLTVPVELAVEMVDAAGAGVVLHLVATAPEDRDPALSTSVRDAVLATITTRSATDPSPPAPTGTSRVAARAVALKAVLPEADGTWTAGELHLLGEWLDRLA